jgi:DNA-binding transcriptional regulator LsrR (DeoR family)
MNIDEEKIRQYWMGRSPKVKAATMKWISWNRELTQKEIAEEYGVTVAEKVALQQ